LAKDLPQCVAKCEKCGGRHKTAAKVIIFAPCPESLRLIEWRA
jgi:hypothetical protein